MLSLLKAIVDLLGVCVHTHVLACVYSQRRSFSKLLSFSSCLHFSFLAPDVFFCPPSSCHLILQLLSRSAVAAAVQKEQFSNKYSSNAYFKTQKHFCHLLVQNAFICAFIHVDVTHLQTAISRHDCNIQVTLAVKLLHKAVVGTPGGIWGVCKCLCVLASVIYSELQSQAPINRWQGARLIAAGQ